MPSFVCRSGGERGGDPRPSLDAILTFLMLFYMITFLMLDWSTDIGIMVAMTTLSGIKKKIVASCGDLVHGIG
jgi:hypothetical protein